MLAFSQALLRLLEACLSWKSHAQISVRVSALLPLVYTITTGIHDLPDFLIHA
jgi:hypothetical protein